MRILPPVLAVNYDRRQARSYRRLATSAHQFCLAFSSAGLPVRITRLSLSRSGDRLLQPAPAAPHSNLIAAGQVAPSMQAVGPGRGSHAAQMDCVRSLCHRSVFNNCCGASPAQAHRGSHLRVTQVPVSTSSPTEGPESGTAPGVVGAQASRARPVDRGEMKKTPKTERISIMLQRTGGSEDSPRGKLQIIFRLLSLREAAPVCRAAPFRFAAHFYGQEQINASATFHCGEKSKWSSSMSRVRFIALSFAAVLAVSSAALAQGGGAGGGGGGGAAGGASSGAAGAAGTTGSGTNAAQSTRGQSSPSGNTAAQPPGSTGQNSINSPGSGVGPGSTGAGISGPGGSGGPGGQR